MDKWFTVDRTVVDMVLDCCELPADKEKFAERAVWRGGVFSWKRGRVCDGTQEIEVGI